MPLTSHSAFLFSTSQAGEVRAAAKEKVAEKVQDFKDKQAERKAARDGTGKEAAEAADALSGLTIQSRVPQPRLLDIPSLAGFIERVAEVNGAGPEVVATFTPFLCAGKVSRLFIFGGWIVIFGCNGMLIGFLLSLSAPLVLSLPCRLKVSFPILPPSPSITPRSSAT